MKWIKENIDGILILLPFVIIITLGLLGIFDKILNFIYPTLNAWGIY